MARIQTENGARNAQVDEYKGRKVEVATGYDANSDKYPVHIYIDGEKVVGRFLADNMNEGFDLGFSVAAQEIDRM
ncbi:hypothetical protein [Burkholderia stagnalis]|uniref:hypothetical protein n=1 Tax=Burkholderia stagnalis TaxID=1503054 RepID=UPI000F57DD2F|nr:hypothetical protein [Burkholderia stagnalis]